jgi:uncharacterized OsmC-like protein
MRVERVDESHARASVRDFSLVLGARRADPAAGFNPVETLLAAAGDCLLTALEHVARLSQVAVAAAVELEAVREEKPPRLTEIRWLLKVASDASDERIERLVALAQANSTVFRTVAMAVDMRGRWERA